MVKAQDFWKYLCEDLDYRFFAGVACKGLHPLYKTMNPEFMHYIPAANERIALGLISGVYVGGFKGGLLMDMKFRDDLSTFLRFNVDYRIPFLVIGYGTEDDRLIYDFPSAYISNSKYKTEIKQVVDTIESELIPGLVVIGKGVL